MTDRRRLDFSNEIYSMSPVRELCVNSSKSRRSSAVIASARPRRLYRRVAEHEKRAAVGRPVGSHLDGTVSIEQAYRVIASDKRQQTEGPLTNGGSATLDAARLLSRLSRALPSVPSAQFHALLRIPERARLPIRGTFGYKRGHPRVVNRGRLGGNSATRGHTIRPLRDPGPISVGRQVGGTKRRDAEEATLVR